MKIRKKLTVVLTFVLTLTISINYFTVVKYTNNIANNSPFIIEDNAKVDSTILAKEKTVIRNSSKVTSRSGIRKPLLATSAETEVEVTTNNEEIVAENTIIDSVVEQTKPMYQSIELKYSAAYNITSSHLTRSKGAIFYNGHKETYYSQRVLPGKGLKALNSNGRHVAEDGTIRDADGYIAVACNYLSKGSRIMTSLGPGKVYDTGGMTGKWIDIYVNW